MAVETKTGKKTAAGKPAKSLFDEKPKQDELTQFLNEVRERPAMYIAIVLFLIACLAAGFLYTAYTTSARQELMTAYARALDKTEPAERVAALEPLIEKGGRETDEVLYVAAEAAFDAGEYDKAKSAFLKLRDEHPDSPSVPDAVEGLGFVAENNKEYDDALALYNEVLNKWPDSFTARRQPINIAKLEERRGNLAEAVAAYRDQLQAFPGSTLAEEANAALARLQNTNPDLFPKAEPTAIPGLESTATAPTTDAAPLPQLDLQLDAPATEAAPMPEEPAPTTPTVETPTPEPAPAAESAPSTESTTSTDSTAPAEPAPPAAP